MKLDANKTNGTSPPHFLALHRQELKRDYRDPSPFMTLGNPDDILTMDEVAAWMKMKPSQIYELTRNRSQLRHEFPLPVLRFHRKALPFRRADVQQWLDALSRQTTEMHAGSNEAPTAGELPRGNAAVAKQRNRSQKSRNTSVTRGPQ